MTTALIAVGVVLVVAVIVWCSLGRTLLSVARAASEVPIGPGLALLDNATFVLKDVRLTDIVSWRGDLLVAFLSDHRPWLQGDPPGDGSMSLIDDVVGVRGQVCLPDAARDARALRVLNDWMAAERALALVRNDQIGLQALWDEVSGHVVMVDLAYFGRPNAGAVGRLDDATLDAAEATTNHELVNSPDRGCFTRVTVAPESPARPVPSSVPDAGPPAGPARLPGHRPQTASRLGHGFVTVVGVFTLASVGLLLVRDVFPRWFPAKAHDLFATLPLVLAAALILALHIVRRTARGDLPKALALVAAFGFWAANTLRPHYFLAPTFNDAAIALFAVDVFLVVLARHPRNHEDHAPLHPSDLLTGLDREES